MATFRSRRRRPAKSGAKAPGRKAAPKKAPVKAAPKKAPAKPKKPRKVHVRGHWVIPDSGRRAYYVQPFDRKRPRKAKRQPKEPRYYCWRLFCIQPIWAITTNGKGFFESEKFEEDDDEVVSTYIHTKFTESRKQSIRLLRSLIDQTLLRVPSTQFETYTLYHVYGPGPVSEKHWHPLETYLDFDDLPKR